MNDVIGMMTLDEAIEHAEEVASRIDTCEACKNHHVQIATWLRELRRRRKIDDGIKKLLNQI